MVAPEEEEEEDASCVGAEPHMCKHVRVDESDSTDVLHAAISTCARHTPTRARTHTHTHTHTHTCTHTHTHMHTSAKPKMLGGCR
jgi:hypothetical protein